ncbi:hypothetical protein [Nonomuraea rubra]|uniref:hypothetical protein n=1 Tax=Nonomuraea rubra TaxID=46180 RepID=UPI0031E6EC70
MDGAAQLAQLRVDLDGVDAGGALGQRDRHVGAAARADDEHVPGLLARPLVRQAVLGLPLQAGMGGHGLLVRDAVDRDVGDGNADLHELLGGDLVVRRPDRPGGERLGQQQPDHDQGGHGHEPHVEHPRLRHEQQAVADGRDEPPEHRRRAEERQRGERGDAGEAADQVVPVGLQARQLGKAPPDQLGGAHEHDRGGTEDHRQDRPRGRTVGGQTRPVQDALGIAVDGDGEGQHDDGQDGQDDGRVVRLPLRAPHAQETEPDAKEGAEQHEIGEITEMDDVGPGPPDQCQLKEEHEGTGEDEPRPHRQPVGFFAAVDRLLRLERHNASP